MNPFSNSGFIINDFDEEYRRYKPWAVIAILVICTALFAGINFDNEIASKLYAKWGVLSPVDIWDGQWWGLFTNNFAHAEIWHIVFNMYWLWLFGKKISYEKGTPFFLLLTLTGAAVSTLAMLAFSDNTGLGYSGINYAYFGFVLVQYRFGNDGLKWQPYPSVIPTLMVWLFACVILTQLDIMHIANAAHFGGFIWGCVLGYALTLRYTALKVALPLIVFAVCLIPLKWAPWSVTWLSHQAFTYDVKGEHDKASEYYNKVLEKDPSSSFALHNSLLIKIEDVKAIEDKGNYIEAEARYDKLLQDYKTHPQSQDSLYMWIEQNKRYVQYMIATGADTAVVK
jgi:membrane associated rhomboid family serine protease